MNTRLVIFNNTNFGIMGNIVLGKNSTQKTTIYLITNMIDKPDKFELCFCIIGSKKRIQHSGTYSIVRSIIIRWFV